MTSDKSEKLDKKIYKPELRRLQTELVKLQRWVKKNDLKVVVVFEGRNAAGKGGTIRRITRRMSSRICRVVALDKPTEKEQSQWYFQRYVPHLPSKGEIVLFDRSWYNRAGVEKVMGFCTKEEYEEFMRECPKFEDMLINSGIILIKYWFRISREEQEKRFLSRLHDPKKRWKISDIDIESRKKWDYYSRARDEMFRRTATSEAPWWIINADDKRRARLNCIDHLLNQIPYREIKFKDVDLPEIEDTGYMGSPTGEVYVVPEKW